MNTVTPPFPVRGPDSYCPDCERLLLKINDDGTFDIADQAGARGVLAVGDGEMATIEGMCFICHPELARDPDEDVLAPDVGRVIAELLGGMPGASSDDDEDEKPDDRIKLPWE